MADADRIVAALLRDGWTRNQLRETRALLFVPDALIVQLDPHLETIGRRAHATTSEIRTLLAKLLDSVVVVPKHVWSACEPAAHAALAHVDSGDIPFLAAALAVGADAIWSRDRHFDSQGLVSRLERLPA